MTRLLIPTDSHLYHQLARLARDGRIVLFAGLPGTGKSLLLQQMGLIARAAGRVVHQLQWDVVRGAFETNAVLERYPEVEGVTHPVIRKAVGLWSRAAAYHWHVQNPDARNLLTGEVPLVGNRLIELVQQQEDEAENLLSRQTVFALPIPSKEVRTRIENARKKSIADPQHEREKKDAPPHVMRALWSELYGVGQMLGLLDANLDAEAYSPVAYREVFRYLLRRRAVEDVPLSISLETGDHSVYELSFEPKELAPSAEDAEMFIESVEEEYPDLTILARQISRWYEV